MCKSERDRVYGFSGFITFNVECKTFSKNYLQCIFCLLIDIFYSKNTRHRSCIIFYTPIMR